MSSNNYGVRTSGKETKRIASNWDSQSVAVLFRWLREQKQWFQTIPISNTAATRLTDRWWSIYSASRHSSRSAMILEMGWSVFVSDSAEEISTLCAPGSTKSGRGYQGTKRLFNPLVYRDLPL